MQLGYISGLCLGLMRLSNRERDVAAVFSGVRILLVSAAQLADEVCMDPGVNSMDVTPGVTPSP